MKKIKVAFYLHQLQKYRVPILELLSHTYDITVFCDNAHDYELTDVGFKVSKVKIKKIGPFLLHRNNIFKLSYNFDVVITLWNIRCLDFFILGFMFWRPFKLIYWGIGTSGSYTKKYGSSSISNLIRNYMGRLSNSNILYSSYPIQNLIKSGINKKKLFVANNTVANTSTSNTSVLSTKQDKNSILFLGSLYKEKGVEDLIRLYSKITSIVGNDFPNLDIIGSGSDYDRLLNITSELNLNKKVFFHGGIYDDSTLACFFNKSIVCISPNQAGLSVLKSMSFGVCFVTSYEAITGGELLNIENKETGILYSSYDELFEILKCVGKSPELFLNIGQNAKIYYDNNRRPDQMASGISDAINYSLGI